MTEHRDQTEATFYVKDGERYAVPTRKVMSEEQEQISGANALEEDAPWTLRFDPPVDHLVKGIMIEISEERAAGRLRPFVEGEPIGVLPLGFRRWLSEPVPSPESARERDSCMEDRRREMLALREHNDATIRRLLS